MGSLNSIEEIRQAFETENPRRVMHKATHFWHRAIAENQESVKRFLIEIADEYPDIRSECFSWLRGFPDPSLALFFLKYLPNTFAIDALMDLGQKKVLEPDDPIVVKPLIELLALDNNSITEPVIAALRALKATSAIDLIATYLEHDHPAIRETALTSVILLSKIAHRDDLLEKAVLFLDNPIPRTRLVAALYLKQEYPERFSELDLSKYDLSL